MNSLQQLVNTAKRYNKIEFWAITIFFGLGLSYFILNGINTYGHLQESKFKPLFEKAGIHFDYYENYFIPLLIRLLFGYAAFLYLNFINLPRVLSNRDLVWNILRGLLLFFFVGLMFGVTNVMLKRYVYEIQSIEATLLELYGTGFLYAGFWYTLFGFYTIVKYAGIYMLNRSVQASSHDSFIRREGVVAFLVWASLLLLMFITNTITLFTLLWIVLIPPAIVLYLVSFYRLIPESFSKQHSFRSYFSKVILIVAALFLPVAAFVWVILQDGPPSVMVSILNSFFQLFVIAPVSWKLFKRYAKNKEEIITLKKELGQSTAGFDFLRSQINPHFLFNALNTLYGTAIEEKAERTSEGVQQLGDMMRFMLHDNMQEKIPLAREIEYINNYISLQTLRTGTKPGIVIESNINNDVGSSQIAPMLLISFIENAFKHGISFREPSHIFINLDCNNNQLYFNVSNSKHHRVENDPEKNKSGVGLENVKQRLQLLYPGKHELIIGESAEEFSVRLILQLS